MELKRHLHSTHTCTHVPTFPSDSLPRDLILCIHKMCVDWKCERGAVMGTRASAASPLCCPRGSASREHGPNLLGKGWDSMRNDQKRLCDPVCELEDRWPGKCSANVTGFHSSVDISPWLPKGRRTRVSPGEYTRAFYVLPWPFTCRNPNNWQRKGHKRRTGRTSCSAGAGRSSPGAGTGSCSHARLPVRCHLLIHLTKTRSSTFQPW